MAILYTLRVFARNLPEIFFVFRFDAWTGARSLALRVITYLLDSGHNSECKYLFTLRVFARNQSQILFVFRFDAWTGARTLDLRLITYLLD